MEIVVSADVRLYLANLSSLSEKARIQRYVDRQMEMGHVVRGPVSKALQDGMYEIRPGPHRLLFFIYQGRIVVVHAFRKRTQKTRQSDLRAAIRKKEEWLRSEQGL